MVSVEVGRCIAQRAFGERTGCDEMRSGPRNGRAGCCITAGAELDFRRSMTDLDRRNFLYAAGVAGSGLAALGATATAAHAVSDSGPSEMVAEVTPQPSPSCSDRTPARTAIILKTRTAPPKPPRTMISPPGTPRRETAATRTANTRAEFYLISGLPKEPCRRTCVGG